MTVVLAQNKDLPRVMEIFEKARAFMRRSGNPTQWGSGYPSWEIVKADMEAERCFLVKMGENVCGVFTFWIGEEITYRTIEDGAWENDAPYGVIHRLASSGEVRGVFDATLSYCLTQIDHIRIDTHLDNAPMLRALEKRGFVRRGRITVADGTPREAFSLAAKKGKME